MSTVIYPLFSDHYIAHDSYPHFPDARPFPPHDKLVGTSFVGERVTADIETMDVWRRLGEHYDLVETLRKQVSAEREKSRKVAEGLRSANAELQQQLEDKERALEGHLAETQRLIDHLEFDRAPQSLKLVLPLARLLRRSRSLLGK